MAKLAAWLRKNAELYLMIAAEETVAERYGATPPRRPKGILPLFFLTIFVPVYRRLPWKLRSAAIHAMPGSHRQEWTARERHTRKPAV